MMIVSKNYHLSREDRKVFEDASLIAIYRFDKPVESVSNQQAKISPNKKAVMLKVDALAFIMGEQNVANKIQLTN